MPPDPRIPLTPDERGTRELRAAELELRARSLSLSALRPVLEEFLSHPNDTACSCILRPFRFADGGFAWALCDLRVRTLPDPDPKSLLRIAALADRAGGAHIAYREAASPFDPVLSEALEAATGIGNREAFLDFPGDHPLHFRKDDLRDEAFWSGLLDRSLSARTRAALEEGALDAAQLPPGTCRAGSSRI